MSSNVKLDAYLWTVIDRSCRTDLDTINSYTVGRISIAHSPPLGQHITFIGPQRISWSITHPKSEVYECVISATYLHPEYHS